MTCKLCLKDKELRNSHIVPEFLHSELYNEKNQMLGINGQGNLGYRHIQKGLREYLLCEECEQHINEYCEKPFLEELVRSSKLPKIWNVIEPYNINVTYETFKLFHLSVLFRAGVSSLPTFSEVQLGPHAEIIRKMILGKNPGKPWEYPIAGLVIVRPIEKEVVQLVSQFVAKPIFGHKAYYAIYGGVQWWFVISSHRCKEIEAACLKESGALPLHAINWNEVGLVKYMAEILNEKIS